MVIRDYLDNYLSERGIDFTVLPENPGKKNLKTRKKSSRLRKDLLSSPPIPRVLSHPGLSPTTPVSLIYRINGRKNENKIWWALVMNEPTEQPTELAALVFEPLLLGAGGIPSLHPFRSILNVLPTSSLQVAHPNLNLRLRMCRRTSPPPFPSNNLRKLLGNAHTDMTVYAKMLIGGLIPLAVTLASREFGKKLGGKEDVLLHGHSYTAHAIGCEVANELEALWSVMKVERNGQEKLCR
ncbi:hypothetical protein DFJ43DRAFT_1222707 [Lentinula guzmanii]|uniref:PLP-dependent transferase n=1 Tax=Lentinula guzmanii TaxID=2804957 RepID=A0AA38JKA0_9AGAR|nr:hypothetical protein DFJ43DRAFT_1222707 [Lentinula guzmanii]